MIAGGALVLTFFGLPETQYPRISAAQAPTRSIGDDHVTTTLKDEASTEENEPTAVPARKSYLQQLNPWSGINPNGQKAGFFWLFIRPWPLILYPAVAYATLVFGFAISALLMVVVTAAEVFQSPPYNFGPGVQSLMFLFGVIGGLFGSIWGGYGTDVLTRYKSSKNNGIFEPENRLVLLVAALFLGPAGVLMYHFLCIVY